jgi:hypothetical protein
MLPKILESVVSMISTAAGRRIFDFKVEILHALKKENGGMPIKWKPIFHPIRI